MSAFKADWFKYFSGYDFENFSNDKKSYNYKQRVEFTQDYKPLVKSINTKAYESIDYSMVYKYELNFTEHILQYLLKCIEDSKFRYEKISNTTVFVYCTEEELFILGLKIFSVKKI